MKELQRTTFFAAYESNVATDSSITKEQQNDMMYYQTILCNGVQNHTFLPEQMTPHTCVRMLKLM
jgi:hypothetical protein